MAPSEQAVVPAAVLQRAQEQIERRKGRWISPAELNEYHPNDALDRATYFYSVSTDHGDGMPIMIRVVRAGDGWRVLEYQYDDDPA